MSLLSDRLTDLPAPDGTARARIRSRADSVLRPTGALARLDDIAVWKAGWQRTASPTISRPVALVFAGDHGVAAAEVSSYPTDVTAAMLNATQQGLATINAFADAAGATVTAVDVGVGRPTADMRHESALTTERFDEITATAFAAVNERDLAFR